LDCVFSPLGLLFRTCSCTHTFSTPSKLRAKGKGVGSLEGEVESTWKTSSASLWSIRTIAAPTSCFDLSTYRYSCGERVRQQHEQAKGRDYPFADFQLRVAGTAVQMPLHLSDRVLDLFLVGIRRVGGNLDHQVPFSETREMIDITFSSDRGERVPIGADLHHLVTRVGWEAWRLAIEEILVVVLVELSRA